MPKQVVAVNRQPAGLCRASSWPPSLLGLASRSSALPYPGLGRRLHAGGISEFLPMGHWDTGCSPRRCERRFYAPWWHEIVCAKTLPKSCGRGRSSDQDFRLRGDPLRLPEDRAQVSECALHFSVLTAAEQVELPGNDGEGSISRPFRPGQAVGARIRLLADFIQHIPLARQHTVTYAVM